MKIVLSLAILLISALWADETADRAAVETTISALNAPRLSPDIFTADFPHAAELERVKDAEYFAKQVRAGTLIISREPMGEATWLPGLPVAAPRFVTRSVTFVAPDTAVVVATYERQSVLLVVKHEGANWRIASFRVLPEAETKAAL